MYVYVCTYVCTVCMYVVSFADQLQRFVLSGAGDPFQVLPYIPIVAAVAYNFCSHPKFAFSWPKKVLKVYCSSNSARAYIHTVYTICSRITYA